MEYSLPTQDSKPSKFKNFLSWCVFWFIVIFVIWFIWTVCYWLLDQGDWSGDKQRTLLQVVQDQWVWIKQLRLY